MFSCIVNANTGAWRTGPGLLLLVLASLTASPAGAAELLMLEQPGCVWCKKFNDEIAPGYAKTEEGRIAPLRRVDITDPWPPDLVNIRKERLTPTFVLIEGGAEVDRLRGYPGDNYFYGLLGEMLDQLPGEPGEGTLEANR